MIFSRLIAGTMKWGSWGAQFTQADYLRLIEGCISLGVTTFDHADIYGHATTEAEFGAALAEVPSLRPRMQLITKCGIRLIRPQRPDRQIKHYDTSKEHIIESVHQSLQRLHTDYIDLLLIHRPDPLMHPDDIAEVFTSLQGQGKVLHFGVSNFMPSQVEMLRSRFPILVNQIEVSILHLDAFTDGTLDQCLTHRLIPMAWSPLGGGQLFGVDSDRHKRITAVAEILGEKYEAGGDQILLSWLLRHPSGMLPVLGTSKIERIQKALLATRIHLTTEEWFLLWRASTGKEVD